MNSDPEETQAAPTESFHTLPTVPAFENMSTWPLLGNDYLRLDYRVGILESARVQEQQAQQSRRQNWQPYALGAGGLVLLALAFYAAKEQVSKELLIGGLVVMGVVCLALAWSAIPPAPASAQASA